MESRPAEKAKKTTEAKHVHWNDMNRKQRREMTRKIQSADLSLEVVHANAAGIDIGNESHYVAVPPDRDSQPVRRFGCTTAELKAMADWLKQCGICTVAMQSTGVYWIAVFDILEAAGLKVYLVNARDTKNLPGRKSDVQESQWLMKLHTYGLLRNSFRPSPEIRVMRTHWRQRNDLVQSAGRHIQRMQKALTQMNLQLANVLTDISGATGQAIIKAILAGERDSHKLAQFRDPRVKASDEQMARRRSFRFLAAAVSGQSHQREQGHWQRSAAHQQSDQYRLEDGGQHLAAKQNLSGSTIPSIPNQVGGAHRDQGHGRQAGPLGLPHAALRDEIRGPRSSLLRASTPRVTDQAPQGQSRKARIPSHPNTGGGLTRRSFWRDGGVRRLDDRGNQERGRAPRKQSRTGFRHRSSTDVDGR